MPIEISFFDRGNQITDIQRKLVREQCSEALSKMERHVLIKDIDILVLSTDVYSQDKWAFYGMALSPHIVNVWMDSGVLSINEDIENYFQSFITHELHHCLRWPYFRKTIGEAIVLEGMAMHAETFLGYEDKELGQSPEEGEMNSQIMRACNDFDQHCDGSWIYDIPKTEDESWSWIYHLGHRIVGEAFRAESWNPFDQIHLSAEEIFEAAGLNK